MNAPESDKPSASDPKTDDTETPQPSTRIEVTQNVDNVAGGKVTGVEVGEIIADRSEVAIGRNIVQIGTLVIPTIPLLALLLVVLAAVGFFGYRLLGPTKMNGSFNIAVAQFGQIDKDGSVRTSEDGKRISQWMFTDLQKAFKELNQVESVLVWHDSLDITQKGPGSEIGVVSGSTPKERADAAAAIAKRINANFVVYGNLKVEGNVASFVPEFYVKPQDSEADEMVGSHQLGTPINVQLPIDADDERARRSIGRELTPRTDALTQFSSGLLSDVTGNHDDALRSFQEAKKKWGEREGKEIFSYFVGREAFLLGRTEKEAKKVFKGVEEALAEAEKNFAEAVAINQRHARAHIGLGNVFYLRAQSQPADERLQKTDLQRALAEYQLGRDNALQASDNQVALVAHLLLGNAERLKGEAYSNRGDYASAEPLFDAAINEIKLALPLIDENQPRLSAQVYLLLGATYHDKAHVRFALQDLAGSKPLFEMARDAYANCLKQPDVYDATLKAFKQETCAKNMAAAEESLKQVKGSNP